jgi:hypothetical protein
MTKNADSTPFIAPGWLYYFSAKGLQEYLGKSPQLKDMVGASEMIDTLPELLVEHVLPSVVQNKNDRHIPPHAAGALRVVFRNESDAKKFAAICPLLVRVLAPGLEFVQAIAKVESETDYARAIQAVEAAAVRQRNQPVARLPETTPAHARNPHSGLALVALDGAEAEPLDAETQAKRKLRSSQRPRPRSKSALPDIYTQAGYTPGDAQRIPDYFDQIAPGRGQQMAVVHADASGLGQMFIRLNRDYAKHLTPAFYAKLTLAIEATAKAATQAGLTAVKKFFPMEKHARWPFLPLVQAGDDFTAVMRADFALDFLAAYLPAYSENSAQELGKLKTAFHEMAPGIPDRLTVCAGLVTCHPHFPYSSAVALCEDLCHTAKRIAKQGQPLAAEVAPLVIFHPIYSSSLPGRYAEILGTELRGGPLAGQGSSHLTLTLAPYEVPGSAQPSGRFPLLANLRKVAEAMRELPRGQMRSLITALQDNPLDAQMQVDRLRLLQPKPVKDLESALSALYLPALPKDHTRLWNEQGRTPWADAWDWAIWLGKQNQQEVPKR